MSTPAAFSRLQLAAALLEYDNDPENPDAPYRSAQESAIFAHFRRNPAARPEVASRKSDYLGVSLPSESGSLGGRESALDTRRSKGSIDALHNPFGVDRDSEFYEGQEEEGEQGLEVDLASWGLDAFMPKDKKSAKAKGKQPAPAIGSTRSRLTSANNINHHDSSVPPARHGLITSKSISLGGDIEASQAFGSEMERRRSLGSPLDLVGMEPSGMPLQSRRRATSQASLPATAALIPFPTGSIRSPSPGVDQAYGELPSRAHDRTYSMASMNSRMLLEDDRNDGASTFFNDAASKPLEDNPFAIQNPSHISRFDPKVAAVANSRARAYSNVTMSTRLMPENDNASTFTTGDPYARERRYSTLELLRPKVLVMPSPLQQVSTQKVAKPEHKVPSGFEASTDGPPLPPGARSTRRLSSAMSFMESTGPESGLVASNSFTPNPLMDLSLSQKTFRNTLAVPGRTSSYMDVPSTLPRATEEGEQVNLDPTAQDEALQIVAAADPNSKTSRPAGKLYGKSLIDDLESRKAQMRNKQRTFVGDQRPSMMARDSSQRASTLIDPATLNARPTTQRMSSYGSQGATSQTLARHPSLTTKPLLNFDEEDGGPLQPPKPPAMGERLTSSRSVFGVDTIWNQELQKLKEIQAMEEKEKEERRIREEEEERRRQDKKDKKKKKKKAKNKSTEAEELTPPTFDGPSNPRVSAEPPMLPVIRRETRRTPPKPSDSDVSSESDDDEVRPAVNDTKSTAWHSSDDEGDQPRRTTGVGPRYPQATRKISQPIPNDDSEEDLPLSATINKARQRTTARRYLDDSDDEDKPLSRVIVEAKSKSPSMHSRNQADEDDDQPLGLRASRIPFKPVSGDDEDDMPLAFHPEQQRRTQYQMMAQQQQQQQQQMMMQAQMQSNMLMNASMMGPGFYNPPMMNPMAMMGMQAPIPMPSPPPIHDEAKLVRVDRWRRDVVVDGDNF